jgi:hypothetical protein
MDLFQEYSEPERLRILSSVVNGFTTGIELCLFIGLILPRLYRYLITRRLPVGKTRSQAEADFPRLRRVQAAVLLLSFVHNSIIVVSDWERDSARACDVYKRFVTMFKIATMIMYLEFLYSKAYAVSFAADEKSLVRKLMRMVIMWFGGAIILSPFFSGGDLMQNNGNQYCVYHVTWYFTLVGLLGFSCQVGLFAHRFTASVHQTYSNRLAEHQHGTKTVLSTSLRRVMIVNVVSVVILLTGVISFMVYMIFVMAFGTWRMRYFVGSVSSLESLATIVSMLLCTVDWEKFCGYRDSKVDTDDGDRENRSKQVQVDVVPANANPEDEAQQSTH